MSKLNDDDDASLLSGSENSESDEDSYVAENNASDEEDDNVSINLENEEDDDGEDDDDDDDDEINNSDNDNAGITFGNSIKIPTTLMYNVEEESDGDSDEEIEDVDGNEVVQFVKLYGGANYDDDDDDDDDDGDDISSLNNIESDSDEDEANNSGEKITEHMRQNILDKYHPESNVLSREEIYQLCEVKRNDQNIIVDDNHRTTPILTKYEKTKILGLRAKQINNGAQTTLDKLPTNLHDVNESTVQQLQEKHYDGYLVALEELKQKKIPVIIRRPLPNGISEYWPLQELEVYM